MKQYLQWSRMEKFDVRLRYEASLRLLSRFDAIPGRSDRVLDAGCGPLSMAHFIDGECVGVDIQFPDSAGDSQAPRFQKVRGSIRKIPFRDGSFQLVASMDTLEHLRPEARKAAVSEMFRVASKTVLIGVPYGEAAGAFDRWALQREREARIYLDWREEHVANGLPGTELDRIIEECISAGAVERSRIAKCENLRLLRLRWTIGMHVDQGNLVYGLIMWTLNGLSRWTNVGSCYRRIYFIMFAK